MTTELDIAHLTDTHLGYEAYAALSPRGNNQRGEDIVRAFRNVVSDIVAWDPPLAIHAGDSFERPHVANRYLYEHAKQCAKLAGLRHNGTRRMLIVIGGNHDNPAQQREVNSIHFADFAEGVYTVTDEYTVIDFVSAVEAGIADPSLADVVVHCLPHECLKVTDFDRVRPIPGKINILTAHGVAGGSELFVRALGREYPIPMDVLARDWDYVALGHFHKQGPVSTSAKQTDPDSRVWYAGSPENISFRDLRDNDNGGERGYLRVTLTPRTTPDPRSPELMTDLKVQRVALPIRKMFRLPLLDGTGMTPEQVTNALLERIAAAEMTGAVVGQIVENVSRDAWTLVDVTRVRAAAAEAGVLHYDGPQLRTLAINAPTRGAVATRGSRLDDVLVERARAKVHENQLEDVLSLARELLGTALAETAVEQADEQPAPAAA